MSSLNKSSVLIVHHAPLMRFGLTKLVQSKRQFTVIGNTGEAPVARRLFAEMMPDLAVLSLTLQHGDGIRRLPYSFLEHQINGNESDGNESAKGGRELDCAYLLEEISPMISGRSGRPQNK